MLDAIQYASIFWISLPTAYLLYRWNKVQKIQKLTSLQKQGLIMSAGWLLLMNLYVEVHPLFHWIIQSIIGILFGILYWRIKNPKDQSTMSYLLPLGKIILSSYLFLFVCLVIAMSPTTYTIANILLIFTPLLPPIYLLGAALSKWLQNFSKVKTFFLLLANGCLVRLIIALLSVSEDYLLSCVPEALRSPLFFVMNYLQLFLLVEVFMFWCCGIVRMFQTTAKQEKIEAVQESDSGEGPPLLLN